VRRAVVAPRPDPGETLPGYVSDQQLDELYESSMLVVVPSKFESASFPIWEAFLRSKPVVAARTTALPRQVGDGGLVVDADDAPGFAEAIERLLADSALRDDMGAAGRAWASQFTWDRTVLATTALYRHVLGRQPRPAEWVALRSDVKI
jgi:glycosyltransferase involved in cell wall biosynthesis